MSVSPTIALICICCFLTIVSPSSYSLPLIPAADLPEGIFTIVSLPTPTYGAPQNFTSAFRPGRRSKSELGYRFLLRGFDDIEDLLVDCSEFKLVEQEGYKIKGCDEQYTRPYLKYNKERDLGEGGFGKTTLISMKCLKSLKIPFVLKRLKSYDEDASLSLQREIYFGQRLRGLSGLVRYIEYFPSPKSSYTYTVTRYEGISLLDALYTVSKGEIVPSIFWTWMRLKVKGHSVMRDIIYQLVLAIESFHKLNVTHRDLKPSNIVMCFYDENGKCLAKPRMASYYNGLKLRIIDFGTSIDDYSASNLYGSTGPSMIGMTGAYMAPEAVFTQSWLRRPNAYMQKYDMFSVGVIVLEMFLSNFTLLMDETGVLFNYEGYCVTPNSMAPQCESMAAFFDHIMWLDPYNIGFPNNPMLDFVRRLLVWNPDDRLSAADALKHDYLQAPLFL